MKSLLRYFDHHHIPLVLRGSVMESSESHTQFKRGGKSDTGEEKNKRENKMMKHSMD